MGILFVYTGNWSILQPNSFAARVIFYDVLPISGKRSSSTEVKILRRHCQKHNPCRTDGESWTCILGTEVFCNQILSLVEIYRQHLPEEVQWQISPPSPRYFQSNGLIILICVFVKISTNPSPRVRSSPSWKSKVTRGFSSSLLHDSCSPLRGSLAAFPCQKGQEKRKIKANLRDQGIWRPACTLLSVEEACRHTACKCFDSDLTG